MRRDNQSACNPRRKSRRTNFARPFNTRAGYCSVRVTVLTIMVLPEVPVTVTV